MARSRPAMQTEAPGLAARRIAADILEGVLRRRRPLDEQFAGEHAHPGLALLEDRDRALVRMLAATVLRRLGTLRAMLQRCLNEGLPPDAPRLESALLLGAAQLLWLDVPNHASVDLSVRLVQSDRRAARYVGLVNAVLRRISQEDVANQTSTPSADIPSWLITRWTAHYGAETAVAIAAALAQQPSLDLTVKSDGAEWAARLRGRLLPTGTVRTVTHGPVSRMPGFAEGAWWVQDAAAALPVRLLGDVAGKRVADLCASPGGKAAQLAFAGAKVTAVDRSANRLRRLRDNFARLGLTADFVEADATAFEAEPFDAVLLDPPCLSTGTIRRHPDISWLKSEDDLKPLIDLQERMLDHAAKLVRPGGTLVYCTCSLEPEEGEQRVASFLGSHSEFRRAPVTETELAVAGAVNPDGDMRTLPCHMPDAEPTFAGMDGFYAARLVRQE
ncbi:MAG: rRNA (cytosine967-C5)-methyltransferase [Variibacter sp.]|nr:rRNA (cytosine967-C5)-methyltransferase [Variibacter sp.]